MCQGAEWGQKQPVRSVVQSRMCYDLWILLEHCQCVGLAFEELLPELDLCVFSVLSLPKHETPPPRQPM
jgi:hypothetical protein